MATFFVLPSRHLLGQVFSDMLATLFPGTQHTPWDWPDLAAALAATIEEEGNAYVVYREDLDEGLSVKDALVGHFGAALDDEIVEIQFGAALHAFVPKLQLANERGEWATAGREKRRDARDSGRGQK